MLSTPLYLFNYPVGHLIAVQLEEQFDGKPPKPVGPGFERMARTGRLTPDLWMQAATGAPVGTDALFRATKSALEHAHSRVEGHELKNKKKARGASITP
jgi:hypothetical protein